MTPQERDAVLQQFADILSDNAGNRITLSLVNGIITTLHGMIQVEVQKQPLKEVPKGPAPEAQKE